jgi:streptogramin lyase
MNRNRSIVSTTVLSFLLLALARVAVPAAQATNSNSGAAVKGGSSSQAHATPSAEPVVASAPAINYEVVRDFFQLPPGENLVEPAGVAVNSQGHIYVFHRGRHPLMEFDASGKFLRSIADDLFVTAHMVRVDADDNLWTTDVGSHVVLKLSPEGRVLLALGRMRIPGDDVLHFNQPTDVAWDSAGNIYVSDGYGNSRVLKFDKYGNPLLGWGMKGSGPGQFDLPHSIVIDRGGAGMADRSAGAADGDLVYVGDRDNARIQIFDTSGRFLREWRLGHPYGLCLGPDHMIYMADAEAGQILKINREGKVVGVLRPPQNAKTPRSGDLGRPPQAAKTPRSGDRGGPEPAQGPHFDPHEMALGKDNSIFTAEVLGWRAQKLRLK